MEIIGLTIVGLATVVGLGVVGWLIVQLAVMWREHNEFAALEDRVRRGQQREHLEAEQKQAREEGYL